MGVWLSPPGFSFQSFEISRSKGFPLQSLTQNHLLIEGFMIFKADSFELKFYWSSKWLAYGCAPLTKSKKHSYARLQQAQLTSYYISCSFRILTLAIFVHFLDCHSLPLRPMPCSYVFVGYLFSLLFYWTFTFRTIYLFWN